MSLPVHKCEVLERSQHVLSLKQSGPKAEMPAGLSMTQSEVGQGFTRFSNWVDAVVILLLLILWLNAVAFEFNRAGDAPCIP